MTFRTIRLVIAGIVAVVADVVQLVLWPIFVGGTVNPLTAAVNDILDFFVATIMVALLGFHWVFLPSALGKLVPGIDLMPFWTGAVFIVGMGQQTSPNAQPGENAIPLSQMNPLLAHPVSSVNAQALPPAVQLPAQPPQQQ